MKFNKSFFSRRYELLSLFLIAIVCLVAYSNSFHVPFQFDGPDSIEEKQFVRDIGVFFDPQWIKPGSTYVMRAVGFFTFALNYHFHGDNVVGYHIVNLVIHILNGLLVYFLVLLTCRTPYFRSVFLLKEEVPPLPSAPPLKIRGGRGSDDPRGRTGLFVALFSSLLFVSHPIQTQAVTYIVQRFTSLATLFYLLSLVMYIKGRLASQRQVEAKDEKDSASNLKSQASVSRLALTFFVLSFLSAVLAMKTKSITFTLPLVIALYEFMFFEGGLKKRILYLVPLLLTLPIIPLSLMGSPKPMGEFIEDMSEVTKASEVISSLDYLFTQFRVIVTYIRLLFFPVNQNLDYDYPVYHSFFNPTVFLSFLFLLSIFGLGIYCIYRSRITHHALRLTAFGIFWFFITLSVTSSVIPIPDVIFEHRLYLPSVGFFIAVTAVLSMLWVRLKGKVEWAGKAVVGGLIAVVFVLSGATYARNTVWQSEMSLWTDVVQKSPKKARPYNGLGLAYQREGELDEAIKCFARAVALRPYYDVARNNLGVAYFKKNLLGRAVEEFTSAIALAPEDAILYNNRGLAYAAAGEIDRAVADYLAAIRLDPSYEEVHHNLGSAYHRKGLYDKALEEYATAIASEPDNAVYYNNRGLTYAARGDFEKAVADYKRAIALKPDFADAYVGMGVVNGGLGRFDAAVGDFTRALSLDSSNTSAYINRAVAYERVHNIDKALSDFQRACEMGDARGCNGVDYIQKKYPVVR